VFENLSARLEATFRRLRGQGRLTEANVDDALKEVRRALLEADVNFKVAREFIRNVKDEALGQEVLRSISPGQQFVKVIHDHLVTLLGGGARDLARASRPPTRFLLVGLQGSGKTTLAAKLALRFEKEGRRTLIAACDVHRPAAVDQLVALGAQAGIEIHTEPVGTPAEDIAKQARLRADAEGFDVLLVDTAGRLHIDEELMGELGRVRSAAGPHEILFVADAMTGQDAVQSAQAFDEAMGIDGVVLTKMDGDARGGAAISIRAVTGKSIKLVSTGEKLGDLEVFHPDRVASRILGMGDVLSLVEKAQESVDAEAQVEMARRVQKQGLTLEDFRTQLKQFKNMGPLDQVLGMMPGAKLKGLPVDDKALVRVEAIIGSMTVEERRSPRLINGSRRKRIARGSGTSVQDVNRLLKQFDEMNKMLRKLRTRGLGRSGLAGLPI